MIRIYMDESGTHEDSPVVSVGAYCGKPREWQRFTKNWNAMKRSGKRPIEVFLSVDCQNLTGEFKGWEPQERDDLVKRLIEVIASHAIVGVAAGFNMRDYRVAIEGKDDLLDIMGSPYVCCFHWVVSAILGKAEHSKNNQALAFIHEKNDYKKEALEAFDALKEGRTQHTGPMTLTFADKKAAAPLQVADILAYEANKKGRDATKSKTRKALEGLGKDRVSLFGYDKRNMDHLVSRLVSAAEEIKTFGHVVDLGLFRREP